MSGQVLRCTTAAAGLPQSRLGIELVFNLMAPDAHDRYFEADGVREPLRWQGQIARATDLRIYDWYLGVVIRITATPAAWWWIAPIHTVSQSEDGFERVYQGSMILPWWDVDGKFDAEIAVEITDAKASGANSPG